jgi:hypothetical protein
MTGIHNALLEHFRAQLTKSLIADIAPADNAVPGVVKIGALQGEPSPEVARISVTIYTNDPDKIINGGVTALPANWGDEVESVEIGGAITHKRRFTVKASCLYVETREKEDEMRQISATVRERIEVALLKMSFSGVTSNGEYVSRGVTSDELHGEMLQAGGPPDAYQYEIKIRFSVLTTRTGV